MTWSCDERDKAGHCRNAHGCHCREIEAQAAQLAERDAEIERLKRMRSMVERERESGLEALLQQAREGLERARKVFIRYADLHRAKRSEDGDLKALANLNEASAITDLLAAIQPGDSHER